MNGPINPAAYREAMRQAKAAIARATEANDVMTKAMVEVLREEPNADREKTIATLVAPMLETEQQDLLLMWAVLLVERAEAARDGA